MERWWHGTQEMVEVLLQHPRSNVEYFLLAVFGFLMLLAVMTKMAQVTSTVEVGRFYPLLVTMLGIVATLAGMLLVRFYLLPHLGSTRGHLWIYGGGLALSLLVVMITLGTRKGSSFMGAATAWIVGLVLSTLLMAAMGALFDAARSGAKNVEGTKSRTAEMDRFLKEQ